MSQLSQQVLYGSSPSASNLQIERFRAEPNPPPWSWATAARGLSLYRKALVTRVLLSLVLIAFGLLGSVSGGDFAVLAGLLKYVSVFVIVATSAVMALGALDFSKQPVAGHGRGAAKLSAICLGSVALLDLVVLLSSFGLLFTLGEDLVLLALGTSTLLAVVGLFSLLLAMGKTARFFGEKTIARRSLGALLSYVFAIAAAAFSLAVMSNAIVALVGVAIVVGLVTAGLIQMLSALFRLARHLEQHAMGLH